MGFSQQRQQGTGVWMGGAKLGSELISSPVSALGALGVAVFNILLEDSCMRGFVWVTASFAQAFLYQQVPAKSQLVSDRGKQGLPLQWEGLCLSGTFNVFPLFQ